MLQEVFELMIQVNKDKKIACVGLTDGSKIERQLLNDGNHETKICVELENVDIGFATFSKKTKASYIYNDQITGETNKETTVAIPYSNISYMEFTDEEDS